MGMTLLFLLPGALGMMMSHPCLYKAGGPKWIIYQGCTDYSTSSSASSSNAAVPSVGGVFCECISHGPEHSHSISNNKSSLAALWVNSSTLEMRELVDHKISVWDLSGACYDRWYFKLSKSPLGYSPKAKSIYAKDDHECNLSWSRNSYNNMKHLYVEKFYRRSQFFSRGAQIGTDPKNLQDHAGRFSCVSACTDLYGDYAAIDDLHCLCYNRTHISHLPQQIDALERGHSCQDFPTMRCGSMSRQSVYKITDMSYHIGFRYWQCIKLMSSEVYERIFAEAGELTFYTSGRSSSILCLVSCKKAFGEDMPFVVLIAFDERTLRFNCRCILLHFFKARREDISGGCMQNVCLDIYGPCSNTSLLHSVYCRGINCNQALLMNNTNDHCDPPFFHQVNPLEEPNVYFVCRSEPDFMYKWEKVVCKDDEEFSPNKLECVRANLTQCIATDGRELEWIADYATTATKSCWEGMPRIFDNSYWTCGTDGNFITKEPNREECIDPWMNEFLHQAVPNDVDSTDLTINVRNSLSTNAPMFGGTLLKVPRMIETITYKHIINRWNNTMDRNKMYTKNIFEIIDNIYHTQDLAWKELESPEQRHNLTFKILGYVDEVGISLFEFVSKTQDDCRFLEHFDSDSALLSVKIESIGKWDNSLYGLSFSGMEADIFVPWRSLDNDSTAEDCMVTIGSTKSFVPDSLLNPFEDEALEFGDTLLNYAVIPNTYIKEPVRISFPNVDRNRLEKCVYWDMETYRWTDEGCSLINILGPKVTCECNHLTSFGVLFSYRKPINSLSKWITITLGSLSTLALIVTQIFLHINYSKQRGRTSKYSVEINRNYCLILSQVTIMLIQDGHNNYSLFACKVIALWSQYIWTATFIWFGLEGKLLYRVLIVVINAHQANISLLYVIGYGTPFLGVTATLVIGVHLNDDDNFLRKDICWLAGNYKLAYLIPFGVIMVWNTYVLIIGTIITYRYCQKQKNVSFARRFSSVIRSGLTLCYILGVPWIFGMFTDLDETFEILFTVMSSLTGLVIFLNSIRVIEIVKKIVDLTSFRSSSASSSRQRVCRRGRAD